MLSHATVDAFRSSLRGRVLAVGDVAYEGARRVFNAAIDRRPALIAQCVDAADVIRCVEFAREHDLLVSVRGGGHSVAGHAVCDDGLVIDLSTMKGIRVDPSRGTVRAETGLTLREFDAETQRFGLGTTLGIVSGTGIAGLTLGGGIGWLNGKHGLACDNALAFDVVTADGRFLKASASEHDDLYWALRGGSGNFGVVTAIEYRLHPVGSVLAGPVFYPLARAKEALRVFVDVSSDAPDELTTMGGLVTLPDGVPAGVVSVCYCGPVAEGERALKPLRSFGAPIADRIEPMSYVAVQSMLDGFFPPGRHHYWKSNLTRRVPDELLEVIVDFAQRKPSPATIVGLQQLHGVAGRVLVPDTAFPHRGNRFDCLVLSQWSNAAEAEANIVWTRELYAQLEPHVDADVYVNNLGDEQDAVVRTAFGDNYERLCAVKTNYDPTNVFRSTHNIIPEARASASPGSGT